MEDESATGCSLLRGAPSRIGRRLAQIVAIAAASLPAAGAKNFSFRISDSRHRPDLDKPALSVNKFRVKAVYTELHRSHDPQFFLVRGVVGRTTEQPERADRLLAG